MRKLLLIAIVISFQASAQSPLVKLLPKRVTDIPYVADSILVNFSLTARTQGIAYNLFGDPKTGVRSGTAPNAGAWTISSIATANWVGLTGSSAAQNLTGAGTANNYFTELPNTAFIDCWFNYGNTVVIYNPAQPHIRVGNLIAGANYEVRMSGCDGTLSFDCNPMQYYVSGATSLGPTNVNGDTGNQTTGATFNVAANGSGQIDIWVVSNASSTAGIIAVLKVKRLP